MNSQNPALLLVVSILAAACQVHPVPVNPYPTPASPSTPYPTWTPVPSGSYLERPAFAPEQAKYFELVEQTLQLSPDELALLKQNGFVVSDRLAFEDFTTAYAYVYWKDMPVVVTTDSILQSVHQSYDDVSIQLEGRFFATQLAAFLSQARAQIKAEAQANADSRLAALYRDADIYLTVPLVLLRTDGYDDFGQGPTGRVDFGAYDTPGIEPYVTLAGEARQVAKVTLLGPKRDIDFTSFAPRGHYDDGYILARYFRAMTWLAQIDFRFVTYDLKTSQPTLHREPIAAALLLRGALARAGLRAGWDKFDTLLTGMVGRSDNITLSGLDAFSQDASLGAPADVFGRADAELLDLLTANDYGWQRITGQIIERHIENPSTQPIPRPASFALMGQRFAVDSYWMSNLVYDRLWVDGKLVERPLPSPLDVAYLLGNDRAAAHLQTELEHYSYRGNLSALRDSTANYPSTFWNDTVYNCWLALLRSLSAPATHSQYPQAMRTAAWADKMLQTQLASWAQLRHDNLLYVKQSVTTAQVVCQYPDGYVEPYPEFFAAVADYARSGRAMAEIIDPAEFNAGTNSAVLNNLRARIVEYYDHLAEVATRLQGMAEKELRLEPFTQEETLFIKGIVIRPDEAFMGCGEPSYREQWDGWYPQLFFEEDKSPALIADVHTNPNNDPQSFLYPPRVLHVGTGPVATMIVIADTDEGPAAYVGPTHTYFETVETGWPLVRLNDLDWATRLSRSPYPQPPAWTHSFRLPLATPPELLHVSDQID